MLRLLKKIYNGDFYLLKLLVNDTGLYYVPKPTKYEESKYCYEKEFKHFKKLFEEKNLVFVLGPWGSGKSTFVVTALEQMKLKESYRIRWASFLPIRELKEAYFHISFKRVWSYALFSFLLLWGYGKYFFDFSLIDFFKNDWGMIALIGSFSTLVYFNTFRLGYIIASILGIPIIGKKSLIIIDDFDRSSLPLTDQFALLANRWLFKTKYIVTLGYHTDEEHQKIIEFVKKIEAPYIHLSPRPETLAAFGKTLDEHFPFEAEEWMESISFRDINNIIFRVNKICNAKKIDEKFLIYIQTMFKLMCQKWNISSNGTLGALNVEGTNSSEHIIKLRNNNIPLEVKTFGTTIDRTKFFNYLENEKISNADNWKEVEISNFIFRTGQYHDLPEVHI